MSISKKTVFFIGAWLLLMAPDLHAEPFYVENNAASKFGRGVSNVIFSPAEYIVQIAKLNETHEPFTSYFGGILQGTYHMVKRIGGGIYEIVTFPVPVPRNYKPLMDPPTPIDALQDKKLLNAN